MYSFEFSSLQSLSQATLLEKDFFIWIWYADKIPPHIGCSINGFYFSLKVNGKDNGISVSKAFQVIQKKAIPSVFVKVKTELNQSEVELAYESYNQEDITNRLQKLKDVKREKYIS